MAPNLTYQNGTQIYVVCACHNDDATDLLAIGGAHSVEVLQMNSSDCKLLASFHVGSMITALAWSSRTRSPLSDDWLLELVAAGADFGLHLLTKTSSDSENIFSFGGGLSGHHGKVNDMSFCGGPGDDSARYVATVSDDKMLMVWDLHPTLDMSSGLTSPVRSPSIIGTLSPASRSQPTAYVIAFPHPLTSVSSHPSTSKEFLVSDCKGSIFLTDWRSDPERNKQEYWRHSSVLELVEPSAMSDALTGGSLQWSGSAAWRRDSIDIVGATYRGKFSIWDMSKLQGGKPWANGISFPEGGHRFRWCQTYPEYFAISTHSPTKGALIHVHNFSFVHAQPTVFTISPRPHLVRDFDFLGSQGTPHIAAAVGRHLVIFSIGVD